MPAHDVAAVQVAVALAHAPGCLRSSIRPCSRSRDREAVSTLDRGLAPRLGQAPELGEIVSGDAPHRVGVAVARVGRSSRRDVQARDRLAERGQVARVHGPGCEQCRELLARVELPHAHRVLERRPGPLHARLLDASRQWRSRRGKGPAHGAG